MDRDEQRGLARARELDPLASYYHVQLGEVLLYDRRYDQAVAELVVALTKDPRLPEAEREQAYGEQLLAGGAAVCLCKLADVYDNLTDSPNMPAVKRAKSVANAKRYLELFRPTLHARCRVPFALVEAKLTEVAAGMTA